MKHWNILMIIALAVSCAFTSCNNDDEPKVTEEWKNGKVLVGEEYIPATTEFTDAEALRILTSSKWQCAMSYTYDNYMFLLSSYDHTDDLYMLSFNKNGQGELFLSSIGNKNMSYVLENKKLIIYTEKYDEDFCVYYDCIDYYELLSADKDRIVMSLDSVHYVEHFTFEPNTATVKKTDFGNERYRYVWIPQEANN